MTLLQTVSYTIFKYRYAVVCPRIEKKNNNKKLSARLIIYFMELSKTLASHRGCLVQAQRVTGVLGSAPIELLVLVAWT